MLENIIDEFGLNEQMIQLDNLNIRYYKVARVDDLYNALLSLPDNSELLKDERIPYWAELWHSAIGLSTFLNENNAILQNKIVLEIACGLGFPSVVASFFAKSVIISDYMKDALNVATLNMQLNNVENFSSLLIDWRNFSVKNVDFDFLICSDIVYEKRSYNHVLQLFSNAINENKKIIFAEPNRMQSKDFIASLKKLNGNVIQKDYLIDNNNLAVNVSVYAINFGKDELVLG